MKNTRNLASVILVMSLVLFGCKKSYLDRYPTDAAPLDDVFKTTKSAEGAVQGLNRLMFQSTDDHQIFGQKSIDLMCDLMGNDMAINAQGSGWFVSEYQWRAGRLPEDNGAYVWTYYYRFINNANQIISKIDDAEGPLNEKQSIKAQALFYRAFAYYNLSIFYQYTYTFGSVNGVQSPDLPCVPIYTQPTTTGNPRATVKEVYDFITSDLNNALTLMESSGYQRYDKSEININVIKGLYARVAMVLNKWELAKQMASEARSSYPIMPMDACLNGFNDWGNSEWIWASTMPADQVSNLVGFIPHMDPLADGYAKAMQKLVTFELLLNAADTSQTDVRTKDNGWWYKGNQGIYLNRSQRKFRLKNVGTYAADQCYMRSAEMLLIEAEADAHLGNISAATNTLQELLVNRNSKPVTVPGDVDQLLEYIYWQRRLELWGEGFSFSDMKRLKKGLARPMSSSRGHKTSLVGGSTSINADDVRMLFRIPGSELQYNPGVDQNP